MAYDLVIRDGLIVDGTGRARFRGDVAVSGDRVAEVGTVEDSGREEIDAAGLVVAPGFVDGHTHMDAQIFWDDIGSSSCWHGITTVVMGNCGFTLAPGRADERSLVVRNLERAEDISAEAIAAGVTWQWSTFSEYLDVIDALPKGLNYAASIGHSALRTWAMGERAFDGHSTPEDLSAMQRELSDALAAGAVGFTTSRSSSHATSDDRPVASRLASWDEITALVGTVGSQSDAVFQLAHETASRSDDPAVRADYSHRLQTLALESGVPILFGVFATPGTNPMLDLIEGTVARGGQMYGLTHCRGVANLQSFRSRLSFDSLPEWQDVRRHPLEAQNKMLQDPEVRGRLIHAVQRGTYADGIGAEVRKPDFETLEVLVSSESSNPTVADEARRLGVDPVELMIDLALESEFNVFFMQVLTPQPDADLVQLLKNSHTAMTFSDSGAHVSQIADASIQSYLLSHWVRERQALTLEEAVRMITSQPARAWRLPDRGVLAPAYAADITIFDPDTVGATLPRVTYDLPGGARRLVQRANGYVATIVNGEVFMQDGQPTEARAGQLLRSKRSTARGH